MRCLNCLLLVAFMLALGDFSTVSAQDKKLPLPAEEVKTPTPAAPTTTTDIPLKESMARLKEYLTVNKLEKHVLHSKFTFSVFLPLDKIDKSWGDRFEKEAVKAYPEDYKGAGPFVKEVVAVVMVSTDGEVFKRVVFTFIDKSDRRRSIGVGFHLPKTGTVAVVDDFVEMSDADEVLKRFGGLVRR